MEGFVMLVNSQEKMAAVKTEDGSYSVLKYHQADQIHVGDFLSGDLQNLGFHFIENHSTGENLRVCIHHAKGIVAAKTKFLIGMART
ncbi:MAG: hypothetical protein ACOH5I_18395 [Oligoflexus sp.]